jgi:hypothetical protein
MTVFFLSIPVVVYCRIYGDPHTVLRFAFIEFIDDSSTFVTFCFLLTVLGIKV